MDKWFVAVRGKDGRFVLGEEFSDIQLALNSYAEKFVEHGYVAVKLLKGVTVEIISTTLQTGEDEAEDMAEVTWPPKGINNTHSMWASTINTAWKSQPS